jgi:hypothetical protein
VDNFLFPDWRVLAVVIALYFLPTVIATVRHHPHRVAIAVLSLLLGWVPLIWLGAAIWSCLKPVTAA